MLDLAIVWHHHQPPYKNPLTNQILLPWVRLHAVKDYLDMVSILHDFPKVYLNFNITPCLIEQILDYRQNQDRFEQLTLKRAGELSDDEKIEILQSFFLAPFKTMIKPYPRFFELFEKRGMTFDTINSVEILRKFKTGDFIDLQVLANLVWIDPSFRNQSPIAQLFEKQRNYTEDNKQTVLKFMREVLNQVLPTYRNAAEEGRIELLTSPFNHPILPLLCDAGIALSANPQARHPDWEFKFPEDAFSQLMTGIEYFEGVFGQRPNGIWLPETAISYEAVCLLAEFGIKWTIADEKILAKSLGLDLRRSTKGTSLNTEHLYTPYQMTIKNLPVKILFRDAYLSDLIGFEYGAWGSKIAAEDLYNKIRSVNSLLPKSSSFLLVIALDGENAWESYENDGRDFLRHFYGLLSEDSSIKTVKISEYLQHIKVFTELKNLIPGSWVNGNFDIWAGSEEDSRAWKMVAQTRQALVDFEKTKKKKIPEAWKEIYIAESSDWFWWFGEEHYSALSEVFDALFRNHLMQVYRILGKAYPRELDEPIKKSINRNYVEPKNFIKPIIDGKETNFYEWRQAGTFDFTSRFSAMHKSQDILRKVYFGFDDINMYLRIETNRKSSEVRIEFLNFSGKIIIDRNGANFIQENNRISLEIAYDRFYEMKIPKSLLNLTSLELPMVIRCYDGETELDVSPIIKIKIWDERVKAKFWQV